MNTLQTDRLVLRPLAENDVNEVYFLRSDAEVGKYIKRDKLKDTDGALLFIRRIIRDVSKGKNYYWAISTPEDSTMIGSICLWNFNDTKTKAEVGYDLHPNFQGKGYMNEALNAILTLSFDTLKLTEVSAYTDYRNRASQALLTRNKFKLQNYERDEDNENNRIFTLHKTFR